MIFVALLESSKKIYWSIFGFYAGHYGINVQLLVDHIGIIKDIHIGKEMYIKWIVLFIYDIKLLNDSVSLSCDLI